MEIYFEYDPFTWTYSGSVVKPKDSWILWGYYYETNTNITLGIDMVWEFATYCEIDNDTDVVYRCGFADLSHEALATSYIVFQEQKDENVQNWTITETEINATFHRMNFSALHKDMDHMGVTGWDTPKLLSTRELIFSLYYGTNSTLGIKEDLQCCEESTDGTYVGLYFVITVIKIVFWSMNCSVIC